MLEVLEMWFSTMSFINSRLLFFLIYLNLFLTISNFSVDDIFSYSLVKYQSSTVWKSSMEYKLPEPPYF